jgi:hypothetical protein
MTAVKNSQIKSRIRGGVANLMSSIPERLERYTNMEKNSTFKIIEIMIVGLKEVKKYEEKMIKRLAIFLSLIPILENEDPGNPDKTAKICNHSS